jgi:DNA-binding MarR family transcriptional regulator
LITSTNTVTDKVDNVNDRSALETLELLHATVHMLRARMHAALAAAGTEHAPMEGRCLKFFVHHPDSTQGDLVVHSGRDKGQIARVIKHLRDEGYLEQVADPNDRRNVRLRPTAKGLRVSKEMERIRRGAGRQAFAGMTSEELAGFNTILERMQQNLA